MMLLGASPGEVVDQIEKVECHQKEGKHEKQSEDDAGSSDNNIHSAEKVLISESDDCRIESQNISDNCSEKLKLVLPLSLHKLNRVSGHL